MKCFTTVKVLEGRPLGLQQHLDQLTKGYERLGLPLPRFDLKDLESLLSQNKTGVKRLNIYCDSTGTSYKIQDYELQNKAYRLKTYDTPFYEESAFIKKQDFSKRLDLLNSARENGADDWIFTDSDGYALETTIANIFWTRGKELFFPDHSLPYYFGVTLDLVLTIAKEMGFSTKPTKAKISLIKECSHLFICNSMKDIAAVESLDDIRFEVNTNLLSELNTRFLELVSRDSL